MKRKLGTAAGALALLFVTTSGYAQTYPSNGYIGVYDDQAHTQCCATWPTGQPGDLWVYAVLGGASSQGITGAEFRLIINLTGFFASWTNNPSASVTIGSPLPGSDPNADYGLNIAWGECQGSAAGDFVFIGSVSGFNASSTAGQDILVTRKRPPSNPSQNDCPLLVLCDFPVFTNVCLTIQTPELPPNDPIGEPVIFRTGLNQGTNCTQAQCGVVAVAPRTWSAMKGLYR